MSIQRTPMDPKYWIQRNTVTGMYRIVNMVGGVLVVYAEYLDSKKANKELEILIKHENIRNSWVDER